MKLVVMATVLASTMMMAGCDNASEPTRISINTNEAGSINAADGKVAIDTPVFKGTFQLPKIELSAENFDIEGVRLYPGSAIRDVAIDARGQQDGRVRVAFSSPATPASVRQWFADQFKRAGTAVTLDAGGLSGTTDGKPFRIELSPEGDTRAAGRVTIG